MKLFKRTVCILMSVFVFSSAILCSAVSTLIFGDANNDKAIDVRDLVHTKKIIATTDFLPINPSAVDFDGDGDIKGNDLVALRKILLNEVTPELSVNVADFE